MEDVRVRQSVIMKILRRFFSRENFFALALCLILIFAYILTADSSPVWIYQGF